MLATGALATWADSEAVLPAYPIGMVLAGTVGRDHLLIRRLRTLTIGLLTPFYFIRAGYLVSIPAIVAAPAAFFFLLTVPAYLADIFGTRYVGAIHGRLLTAWSTAGIVGPVIVNYLHDTRLTAGVSRDRIYGEIFYVLAALLALGFLCNALIRPVHAKWHMRMDAGRTVAGRAARIRAGGGSGIGRGGLDVKAVLAWAAVGIPLSWGIWKTLENAAKIFL